jgi:transposase
MKKQSRKSYSREFKSNVIRMVCKEGYKVSEVARNLDIHENIIYSWKQKYMKDQEEAFPGKGNLKSSDAYVRQLEQENKRLKDERDILKKAALFFAKDS